MTLTAASRPELIYDYYGFPAESYQVEYPAAGEPLLARTIAQQLEKNGIEATLHASRGFDHGILVLLCALWPPRRTPYLAPERYGVRLSFLISKKMI
ncbi:hypothetical protein [Desulfurispirillum indicum]|uniref:DODA-type extradiol aromatic ring-opening family dioxygenase n=1 Tax=Desulfurispirillum indicum TaxID=936456 RepID=UPI000A03C1E1